MEVLLECGNGYFFTASLEIQLLIFSGDFELGIINSLLFSKLCLLHAPFITGFEKVFEANLLIRVSWSYQIPNLVLERVIAKAA